MVEQRYYAEVNRKARWEVLRDDPSFREALLSATPHVGVFSDHGVVHVRDVARQALAVLSQVHGLLIPRRSPARLTSLQGLCVTLAYVHDVGMSNFSPLGRAMHPEFAAQCVFDPQQDDILEAIWQEDSGGLAGRLAVMEASGALARPRRVLREVLALSMGHSKSKVPIAVLNGGAQLRQTLMTTLSCDLGSLYASRNSGTPPRSLDVPFCDKDGFDWLLADHPEVRALADDVIDAVRVVRCADALRQRGTVLKTSGGYEIFVSRISGRGTYAFVSAGGHLFLLEDSDPLSAGEANMAASEIDANGDLRVAFHRGAFDTPEGTAFAVAAAARVVGDMERDILESFLRPAHENMAGLKPAAHCFLLLEEADDSAEFAVRVMAQLAATRPALRGRMRLAPSLRQTSDRERALYLAAPPLDWSREERLGLLRRLGRAGQLVAGIDPDQAFHDVRLATLQAGDTLIEAGEPAAFVYIPLDGGLIIRPLGGYGAFAAQAWLPLGITGVLRGAPRNATITAQRPLSVIMIPKGVYLREWHRSYTPEELYRAVMVGEAT